MKTVEKCSPDFFPQMHTCCQWQMLCCRAIRWIILSSVDVRNAAVLSFPVLAVLVNCLGPPLLFCERLQFFMMTANIEGEGDWERLEEGQKYTGLFFTLLTWVGQHCLLTCEWKSFQELKCSMPQSHDIHLTPSLPSSCSISTSWLSPESVCSYYRLCPCGILFKHPSLLLRSSYCNWPAFVPDLNRC